MQALLSPFHHSCGINRPGEVIGDVDTKKSKVLNHFHTFIPYEYWKMFPAAFPDINYEFFSFFVFFFLNLVLVTLLAEHHHALCRLIFDNSISGLNRCAVVGVQ